MGTRSLTLMYDGDAEVPFFNMYRQMDGYPSGHGLDLAKFLGGMVVVNGFGLQDENVKFANGPNCLAAQLVAHFKDGVGGIYLYAPTDRDFGQEYEYHIHVKAGEPILMRVYDGENNLLYEMNDLAAFAAWCEEGNC